MGENTAVAVIGLVFFGYFKMHGMNPPVFFSTIIKDTLSEYKKEHWSESVFLYIE